MRTLLWLLLCALPLAAQDQDPAALLPADTLVYAEVDAGALADGLPQLDVAKMLGDPAIRAFVRPALETLGIDAEKPVETLLARVPVRNFIAGRAAVGVIGVTFKVIGSDGAEITSVTFDASHPLSARQVFQLFGAGVNAGIRGLGPRGVRTDVTPQFVLVAEPGPAVKAMTAQVLQHVEQQALQLGDRQAVQLKFAPEYLGDGMYFAPDVYADMSGDRWIIASSTKLLQRAWAGGGRSSLSNSPRFTAVRERMTGGARVAFAFLDAAKVADVYAALAPPLFVEAADIAGIRSIRGAGLGISLVEGGVRESFGLVLDGQPKGVWRLLDAFPGGLRSLEIAPPGAVYSVGVKFDPKLLVERAQEVVNELMPGNEGLVKMGLGELSREAGFDVEEEIVNALGDEMALIVYPPPVAGMPIPNFVFGVDLADEAAFKRLLERAKAAVANEVSIQPLEIREGLPGFQVFAPIPVSPVFTVAKGHFFGASSREQLLEVIDKWGAEGAPSLVRDGDQFKKVLRGLNGGESGNLVMLAYMSLHGLAPQLPQVGWMLPSNLFDQAKMPTTAQLQAYLSGMAIGLRRDADGVTLDLFTPTGVVTPAIGVAIHEAREDHARTMRLIAALQSDAPFLGLTPGLTAGGLYVRAVAENGPAAKAGIKPRDVMVALDGRRFRSEDELRQILLAHQPGQTVKVKIRRSGEEMEFELTLGRRGDYEDR